MEQADFLERLTRYGDMAKAALLEWLPEHEPRQHLYGPIRDYIQTSGKGLRPALVLATCRAFGGRSEDALVSAAAIELLHNAFLIHDDIEDESEFRRGRPCMHTRMGVPIAINAGDAMQAMALRLLRRNFDRLGAATAGRILDEFDHLLVQSLEGQAMELGWIRDNDLCVGPADYLRMTLKKTCWYSFIHPCRLGALIARPEHTNLEAFNAFGFHLGTAFQIQDDVLNLAGQRSLYGKEIMGDILEGKRTLMLARLSALAAPAERRRLADFLSQSRRQRSNKDVDWVFGQMEHHGCLEYASEAAASLAVAARRSFALAFKDASGPDKEFVAHCIDFVVNREV